MLKAGLQNKPDERPGHLTMARAGGPSLFAINGNNSLEPCLLCERNKGGSCMRVKGR